MSSDWERKMDCAWFGDENQPQEAELARRRALMDAVEALPDADKLSETEVEDHALWIYGAVAEVIMLEWPFPDGRPRGEIKKELQGLIERIEALEKYRGEMKSPEAVSYLHVEMAFPQRKAVAKHLRELRESAEWSLDELERRGIKRGKPVDERAREVARSAYQVFEEVTGRRPTYTTNTLDYEITGAWPGFLRAVFAALGIEASVEAQVKRLSQKKR